MNIMNIMNIMNSINLIHNLEYKIENPPFVYEIENGLQISYVIKIETTQIDNVIYEKIYRYDYCIINDKVHKFNYFIIHDETWINTNF
jgi:hypothetical protein